MFEIKVTLDATSRLESAIYRLAEALSPSLSAPAEREAAPAVPAQKAVAPAAAPSAPSVTANSVPAAPAAVPVSTAPAYTLEQVSNAGASLVTANPAKMTELQALLAQFHTNAVANLKPDQIGAFATALRGLGANI